MYIYRTLLECLTFFRNFLHGFIDTSTRSRETVYGERTGEGLLVVCAPESILTGTLVIGGVAWELAKILVVKFMQALDRSLNRKPTPFDTFSKLALLILKSVEFSIHHSQDIAQLSIIRTIHLLHPLLLLFYNDHGFYRITY